MRSQILVALLALWAAPSAAQTTGFPGLNDYTVAGLGSGSTSCATLLTPPPGGGFALSVRARGPGLPVLFALSFAPPTTGASGGCVPGAAVLPASGCLPIPGPGALSNQFLDLALGPPPILVLPPFAAVTGAGGLATVAAPPLPPAGLGLVLATQAFVLDPLCGAPFLATQAHRVAL